MIMYIIVWKEYGRWNSKGPFDTEADAEAWIVKFLRGPGRDYNEYISTYPITYPNSGANFD